MSADVTLGSVAAMLGQLAVDVAEARTEAKEQSAAIMARLDEIAAEKGVGTDGRPLRRTTTPLLPSSVGRRCCVRG
jgi:hypothetical protein